MLLEGRYVATLPGLFLRCFFDGTHGLPRGIARWTAIHNQCGPLGKEKFVLRPSVHRKTWESSLVSFPISENIGLEWFGSVWSYPVVQTEWIARHCSHYPITAQLYCDYRHESVHSFDFVVMYASWIMEKNILEMYTNDIYIYIYYSNIYYIHYIIILNIFRNQNVPFIRRRVRWNIGLHSPASRLSLRPEASKTWRQRMRCTVDSSLKWCILCENMCIYNKYNIIQYII